MIEQCYICLTELFHFLEQGPLLEQLTSSGLCAHTMALLINWQTYPYLPLRVFRRVAAFLKELAQDNPYAVRLHSPALSALVLALVESLNPDNCDFAANMVAFLHFVNRAGPDLLGACCEKVFALDEAPQ